MDDMACTTMGQGEAQDKFNDAEKSNISEIEILPHFWKRNSRNLMVKVTGLYTLGDDAIEAEYVKVENPYALAL